MNQLVAQQLIRMFALLPLILSVTLAATASSAQEGDACPPFQVKVEDCCTFKGFIPELTKANLKRCKAMTFPRKKLETPEEIDNVSVCFVECMFAEEGLLTADKVLDKDLISEFWSGTAPFVVSAKDACLSRQVAEEPGRECRSGTRQFIACLNREVFLHCPTDFWTGTAECQEIKDKVTRCPDTVVMFKDHHKIKT